MKKVLIILTLMVGFFNVTTEAQPRQHTERMELNKCDKGQFRKKGPIGRYKKAKMRQHRKMRRLAKADGRITPRERRIMRHNRNQIF